MRYEKKKLVSKHKHIIYVNSKFAKISSQDKTIYM